MCQAIYKQRHLPCVKLFKNQTFQIKVRKELEELEAEQNVKNSIILTKLFTIVGFQNILGFKLSQPNQHINIHALEPCLLLNTGLPTKNGL